MIFVNIKISKSNFLENFSLKNWNDDLSVGLTGAFLCSKIGVALTHIVVFGVKFTTAPIDKGLIISSCM